MFETGNCPEPIIRRVLFPVFSTTRTCPWTAPSSNADSATLSSCPHFPVPPCQPVTGHSNGQTRIQKCKWYLQPWSLCGLVINNKDKRMQMYTFPQRESVVVCFILMLGEYRQNKTKHRDIYWLSHGVHKSLYWYPSSSASPALGWTLSLLQWTWEWESHCHNQILHRERRAVLHLQISEKNIPKEKETQSLKWRWSWKHKQPINI